MATLAPPPMAAADPDAVTTGGQPGGAPIVMVSSWWPTENDPHANPFVVDHARALHRSGDVSCWLVAGGSRQVTGAFVRQGLEVGSVVTRHPRIPARLASRRSSACLLLALGWLQGRASARQRPRAVVLQSFSYAGPYAVGLARAFGCPLVYLEHWSAVGLRALTAREVAVLRRVLAGSDRVLAVSRYLASALEEIGGLAPGSVGVVENVVDPSRFAPRPPHRHPGTVIAHVADFRPVKGHGLLVDALLLLGPDHLDRLDLRFVLVGDGPERASVQHRLAAVPDIAERVSFAGKLTREGVAEEMALADWTLLTSRVETSSCVARESLAVGRPVIAPRVGALPELIGAGDGILFERTPAALAAALLQAAGGGDPGSWQARAAAAAARFAPEALDRFYRALVAELGAR